VANGAPTADAADAVAKADFALSEIRDDAERAAALAGRKLADVVEAGIRLPLARTAALAVLQAMKWIAAARSVETTAEGNGLRFDVATLFPDAMPTRTDDTAALVPVFARWVAAGIISPDDFQNL
jgi:hypothetical protein